MTYFYLAQFQNIQKKKVEQTQRKALLQELEEKQLKRRQPKQVGPRGSITSYGTSDDDVFYEPVSYMKFFSLCQIISIDFFPKTQRTAPQRHPTAPTVSRPLKDVDAKEGQPIQLTCQIQGFPKAEVCSLIFI